MSFKYFMTPLIMLWSMMIWNNAYGQASPQSISPLKNGDKVLFIGNSLTEWSGPLPSALQALIRVSGSNIEVTFASKVKGMGILKEYATWKSIGAMAEIQKGGWTYVVIQGWTDAIDRKDCEANEDGTRNADYLGYPECQQVMLHYFKILDAEVKKVGAKTILYEPHVGMGNRISNMAISAETYKLLKNEVSCFHAPIINAWEAVITRHPDEALTLLFAPDGGHQNTNGMALDAMTFYTIFTGMSAATLKPNFPATMSKPQFYEELAEIAYRTGKEILAANNCAIVDSQAPTTPTDLTVSNKLSESFTLNWTPSKDDVGVLGYKVFQNEEQIGTTSTPQFSVGNLAPATAYSMKIVAYDSESKVSFPMSITVTTENFTSVDNTGVLYEWDFIGVKGESKWAAKGILPGMSGSLPAAVMSIHSPMIARADFNQNALIARNGTAITLENAIAEGQYFSFTFASLKGNTYSIKKLDLQFISEGPHNFTIMSEHAGFKAEQAISTTAETSPLQSSPIQSIAISGHEQLNTNTEFRIYVWGSNNPWTGFGLGKLSISGSVKSESTAPFPSGLYTSNLSETGFNLGWKAAKDAVDYEVFKDGVSIGKTNSLTLVVRDVKINCTYNMTVKATNTSKQVSEASSVCTVKIPDLSKPSVPKNLTVSGLGANSFILNWQASTDNVGVALYEVSKNELDGGTTAAIFMPEPFLLPNTTYTMKVRAKDAAGNYSDWSKSLVVKTLSLP